MVISKVRLQRTSGKTASKRRLPAFRVGQLVRGKVRRILGNGYLQVRIKGQNLVASSDFSVAVEEELLLRVVKLRPRPHLQVLRSMENSGSNTEKDSADSGLLGILLDRDIPVTDDMLKYFGKELGAGDLRRFTEFVRRYPEAWRRIIWSASFSSGKDLLTVGEWLDLGAELFSTTFLSKLEALHLPANTIRLQNDITKMLSTMQRYLQEVPAEGAVSTQLIKGMQTHWAQWHLLRNAIRAQGTWYGSFLPFLWEEQCGVMAFSYWKPDREKPGKEPARLSLISALANGWILQFLLEYRETDLAGAIDVNSGELAVKVEDLLPKFRHGLQRKGYSQAGLRVRTVKNLRVDYAQLLPVEQEPLAFAG